MLRVCSISPGGIKQSMAGTCLALTREGDVSKVEQSGVQGSASLCSRTMAVDFPEPDSLCGCMHVMWCLSMQAFVVWCTCFTSRT